MPILGAATSRKRAHRANMAADHPVLYAGWTLWGNVKTGVRNLVDHFAQQSKGLERRIIPFARSSDT